MSCCVTEVIGAAEVTLGRLMRVPVTTISPELGASPDWPAIAAARVSEATSASAPGCGSTCAAWVVASGEAGGVAGACCAVAGRVQSPIAPINAIRETE